MTETEMTETEQACDPGTADNPNEAPNPQLVMLRKLVDSELDRRLGNWLCTNRTLWVDPGPVGDYIRGHVMPLANPDIPEHIFVMTATMYWVGRVIVESRDWIVITDAAWVPDTGRFAGAMGWTPELAAKEEAGTLKPEDLPPMPPMFNGGELQFSEVEPYPWNRPLAIAVGGIISATPYPYPLPRGQK